MDSIFASYPESAGRGKNVYKGAKFFRGRVLDGQFRSNSLEHGSGRGACDAQCVSGIGNHAPVVQHGLK